MKTPAPISAEDFEKIAPLFGSCELVDGEIAQMAPGGLPHSVVSANVAYILGAYVRKSKLGRVITNEAGVFVKDAPDTVRGVDVGFLSYKRVAPKTRIAGFLRTPPELLVEVLGHEDTWKKIEDKIIEYHRFGVDLVWVVDPNTQSLRVYPKGRSSHTYHGEDKVNGGKVLPGFSCKTSDFFTD